MKNVRYSSLLPGDLVYSREYRTNYVVIANVPLAYTLYFVSLGREFHIGTYFYGKRSETTNLEEIYRP